MTPSSSATKSATGLASKTVRICTHIKVTGIQCGSPALRGKVLCYFHQRMTNFVPITDSRIHHAAMLESEEAIQAAIMELVNSLIRGTMEVKRGEVILRALNAAVRNSRRVRFGADVDKMVRDVPTLEIMDAQIADTKAHEAAEQAEAARAAAELAEQRRQVQQMVAEARARATAKASGQTAAPLPSAATVGPKPEVQAPTPGAAFETCHSDRREEPAVALPRSKVREAGRSDVRISADIKSPTPKAQSPTPALRKPPQSAQVARTPSSARSGATKAS